MACSGAGPSEGSCGALCAAAGAPASRPPLSGESAGVGREHLLDDDDARLALSDSSTPSCAEIKDSSSSLSSPGNSSAEVKELRRTVPLPIRIPGLSGGAGLAMGFPRKVGRK